MLKHSILAVILATGYALPGFAVVTSESKCDIDTLGVDKGLVELESIWNPVTGQCASGTYFAAATAECTECTAESYCPGVNYTYDGQDQGLEPCGDGWTSATGASLHTQCYKMGTKSCAEHNPYTHENGTAIYAQETVDCVIAWNELGDETNCVVQVENEHVCDYSHLSCDAGYVEENVGGVLQCVSAGQDCPAGTYLPKDGTACVKCLEDNYCVGGTYSLIDNTVDQGITSCSGLKSPAGSRKAEDCGRVLHVGSEILHLHSDNTKTNENHVVAVKVGEDTYYADVTPITGTVKKPIRPGSSKVLRIKIGDQDYSVHERTYED